MPPKDSATEMLYRILDNMSGIGVNYDAKTNTITYTNPHAYQLQRPQGSRFLLCNLYNRTQVQSV